MNEERSSAMAQKVKKDEKTKKEQVIKAAVKLFSEQGYHDTAVSEIADEAEVAKGTVYWYFDSKEQLFWGIIVSGIEALNQKVVAEVAKSDKTAQKKLETIIRLHLEFFKDNKEVSKMMQESSVSPGEYFHTEMEKLRKEAIGNLAKIIKQGQQTGEFKAETNEQEIANFILGSIFGSYNPHAYQLQDIEEKVELILNILCNVITV